MPLKYAKGPQIETIHELIGEISDRRYVIEGEKRMHPGWMLSRQLSDLINNLKRKRFFYAIENKETK